MTLNTGTFPKQLMLVMGLLISCVPNAQAKLHFTEIKGMQENVQLKSGFEYLDPIGAFNLQRQGFLINLINYPEQMKSGGIDKDGKPILINDPLSSWIKSIYVAPLATDNPTFFQVSPLAKNLVRFLGPSAIGKILGKLAISSSDKEKFRQGAMQAQFKKELSTLIENDSEFNENKKVADQEAQEYQNQLTELELPDRKLEERSLIQQRDQLKNLCKSETITVEKNSVALNQLMDQLAQINKKINFHQQETVVLLKKIREESQDLQGLRYKRDQLKYEKKYLNAFLDRLIQSWLAEDSDSIMTGGNYPSHLVEKSLVSLAWMNTRDHDKSQFLTLYERMPHVLKGDQLVHGDWQAEQYKDSDYQKITQDLIRLKDSKVRAHYLLSHREEAAFLSHGQMFFDKTELPEIGYKSVDYQSNKTGKKVFFTDCMESSSLNFLANVLRNPETGAFDPNWIQKNLEVHPIKINTDFEKFIKNHPNLSSLDSLEAHEDWARLVSEKKDIKYVQSGYEMDTQVSNIFSIIDHLLPGSIYSDSASKTNAEKMDQLCKVLSHDQAKLDWTILGENTREELNHKNTDVTFEFTLNGAPYFYWRLSSGHSEIDPVKSNQKTWKQILSKDIISLILSEKDLPLSDEQIQILLGVVSKEEIVPLIENLGSHNGLIRSFNLDSNEVKLAVLEGGLEKHLENSYAFLKKIDATMPTAFDLQTRQRREVVFANADYPWGEPLHVIGKPNLQYPRPKSEELKQLVEKYGKSFEKARITPRGWIVGDVIKNEDGSIATLDWEAAKAKCKSLNPSLTEGEQAVLLPIDEYKGIKSDFASDSSGEYVPQYLPNLDGRYQWSSSVGDRGTAWKFGGLEGYFFQGGPGSKGWVRCGVRSIKP